MISKNPRFFFWVDTETTGVGADDIPIEIAVVVTNEQLEVAHEYSTLIVHPELPQFVEGDAWNARAQRAYAVHKIELKELSNGTPSALVTSDLTLLTKSFTIGHDRPIVISDNPVFEFRMLRKLSPVIANFHYSAWSPIMLWNVAGVEYTKPHRAAQDVQLMIETTRRAIAVLRGHKDDNYVVGEF